MPWLLSFISSHLFLNWIVWIYSYHTIEYISIWCIIMLFYTKPLSLIIENGSKLFGTFMSVKSCLELRCFRRNFDTMVYSLCLILTFFVSELHGCIPARSWRRILDWFSKNVPFICETWPSFRRIYIAHVWFKSFKLMFHWRSCRIPMLYLSLAKHLNISALGNDLP